MGRHELSWKPPVYLHYILTKNKFEFCLCPENLNVFGLQTNEPILLKGQILEQVKSQGGSLFLLIALI